jgi:putative colanic acid biosynthesis acetyltransferase WcaB
MNFFSFIAQDQKMNKGNTKGRIVTFFFRIGNYCAGRKYLRILFLPYRVFYKFFFEWIIGMEIPYDTRIGKGLRVFHLQAIVINRSAVIGENFTLRHSTTIGNKEKGGRSPVIGNNVDMGAHVCIIGGLVIGDNVNIGAGSVVVKDIPSFCTVVGNPARIIKQDQIKSVS